jgi:hypothetical protein
MPAAAVNALPGLVVYVGAGTALAVIAAVIVWIRRRRP